MWTKNYMIATNTKYSVCVSYSPFTVLIPFVNITEYNKAMAAEFILLKIKNIKSINRL